MDAFTAFRNTFAAVIVGGAAVAMAGPAHLPAFLADMFPVTTPHQCSDFRPHTLNAVLANAPLVKLTGIRVLEVTDARDAGSSDKGLKCDVDVVASSGADMTIHASTKTINGNPYIMVSLF